MNETPITELPCRSTEIVLRDDCFVVRETYERSAGNQEALLAKLLGGAVKFLPVKLPGLQDFCKGTYLGFYSDGRVVVATEIEYFPINGVALVKNNDTQGTYRHIYLPEDAGDEYVSKKYGYENYDSFIASQNPIFPIDRKLRWSMDGLRMFLIAPFHEDNKIIMNMHFFGIDAVKGLVCPGMPNVFADTRICMGDSDWSSIRENEYELPMKDPLGAMQNALKSFISSNNNTDLDSVYAYKSLKWDKEANLVDTVLDTRAFNLPVASTELLVAFYKFIQKEEL